MDKVTGSVKSHEFRVRCHLGDLQFQPQWLFVTELEVHLVEVLRRRPFLTASMKSAVLPRPVHGEEAQGGYLLGSQSMR